MSRLPVLRFAAPVWLFSIALWLSPALAGARDAIHFPFPVKVDESKGKAGIYPNRVQDRRTGIWYIYVPAGKYRIGTNERPDSQSIEVTLSAFYIAERQVTHAQVAHYLEERLKDELKKGEAEFPKGLSPAELQDWRLVNEALALSAVTASWIEDQEGFFGKLLSELASRGGDVQRLRLTPELRQEAQKAITAFRERLALLRARDTAFGSERLPGVRRVSYEQAVDLAKWAQAGLPTEAQWEAAARLGAGGRLPIEEMLDDVLEWCADHYAYDYCQRRGEFHNPRGPGRGRLSKEQLAQLTDSSVGIMPRWKARHFRVLKGQDPGSRFYGHVGDLFPYSTGVRLVYMPGS